MNYKRELRQSTHAQGTNKNSLNELMAGEFIFLCKKTVHHSKYNVNFLPGDEFMCSHRKKKTGTGAGFMNNTKTIPNIDFKYYLDFK